MIGPFRVAIAVALFASLGRAQGSIADRGISMQLAQARAHALRDVRYSLTLDITARDSAVGSVGIRFSRSGSTDVIVDYRGRRVTSLTINGVPVERPEFSGNHLLLPARALRSGDNDVRVGFVSEVAASGASIIRTHDAADGSDYLYTLLVPADANQLFPCFDQPDLKARLALTLVSPRAWTVLANGSAISADTSASSVTTQFIETRPLSTYLVAFAAGPWTRFEQRKGARTVGLYVRRSRAGEVDADTLLGLTHRALEWMEAYFGRPYPFEKFDIMLAPAFPFGGMEHPGVVMFNEDRFIFRDRPTLARRVGRFSTVLHEVAHQWFGDLVTMKWFDDLWLKEGFATYMGAKALADLEPTGDAWKSFFQSNKPAAYAVDQTLGTTPLWQSLGNLDQAKSAYGAIVYNKAPSVLKQLNYLVGERAFQQGVRDFLGAHAYANATWQDLLASIGTASGVNLDLFGKNFMLRPGMPIVEPEVVVRDGRISRLTLRQRPAQPGMSGGDAWPMRTQVLLAYPDGKSELLPVDLTSTATVIPAAAGKAAPLFVFPNAADYGYFLSLLDSASVRALEAGAIRGVGDPLLRTMLWNSLWDQVRDSRLAPGRVARLILRELPFERDEQIVPSLTARLERAIRAYLPESDAALVRRDAEAVLWMGANDRARAFGIRRGFLDAFIAVAATDSGRARLAQVFSSDSAAGEPVRDPTRWAIVDRLLVLGDVRADRLLAEQARRDTTPDGRRRTFTAGAARNDPAVKGEYFRRYFADRTLNEDWASGSLGAFNSVEHQSMTLAFLKTSLDSLPYIQQNRRIFFLGAWLGAFLGGQTSDAALTVVHDWLRAHPDLPLDLRQKVLQSADELERTVRIRSMNRTATSTDDRRLR